MKTKTKTLLTMTCISMSALILSCTKEKQALPDSAQQVGQEGVENPTANNLQTTPRITVNIKGVIQKSVTGRDLTVQFSPVSSTGYVVEAVDWNFGDGSTSNDLSPLFTCISNCKSL